jgi:hypothetical protein
MAKPILRVELDETAVDFQPLAGEPGLPMLDHQGAADAIMRRWLGELAAEPRWQPDGGVRFFVRQGSSGRLEDASAQTITPKDLEGPLNSDFEQLQARIKGVRVDSSEERLLWKTIRTAIERFADKPERADLDWRLFKYRHRDGPWRLVWCWGYQPARRSPAFAHICPNSDCRLLFLRKPGMRNKCPSCHGVVPKPKAALAAFRWRLATACLLLLLMAGSLWLLAWPDGGEVAEGTPEATAIVSAEDVQRGDRLRAEPETLNLRLGQSKQLALTAPGEGPIELTSASPAIVAVAEDGTVTAVGLGNAEILVRQGDLEFRVPVEVGGAEIARLRIETDIDRSREHDSFDFTPYGPVLDERLRFDRGRYVGSPYGPAWLPPDVGGSQWPPLGGGGGGNVIVPTPRLHRDGLPPIDVPSPADGPEQLEVVIAGVPVKLYDWRPTKQSSTEMFGEFDLAVNQLAEYRLTTKAGRPLSDWKTLAPGRVERLTTRAAFTTITDGAYELVVERRVGLEDVVRTFSIYFTLRPAETNVSATR